MPTPTSIIASDGLNSRIRAKYAATYQPDIDMRDCRFVWLGTHKLFEAFTFAFEETEHGWFQAHAYRFDDDTSTFIVETPEEVWQQGRPRHDGEGGGDRLLREAVREVPGRPRADVQRQRTCAARRSGSSSRASSASSWVHHNGARAGRADGRRRAHRALLDRLGHQARARGCDRARALHRPGRPRRPGRARCADYEAVRSVEVLSIQNAARNSTEWFENVDALRQPAAGAVRLFAADAQPAHQPREPAPARQGLRRGLRGLDRRARRRRSAAPPQQPIPPMFTPFTRARRHAEEPRRRLADGAVLVRRRHAGRLPPRAPRRARDGRRRHGRRRDDLPVARRAHHARLPGPVERGAARRLEAHRRLRARATATRRSRCSSATPAPRARRACLGRRGPAAASAATGR